MTVELVPDTGQTWFGRARMASARLAAYGANALDELDRAALRRHPACTERRAASDADGWGWVGCGRGVHDGACRFGAITHDDGAVRRSTLEAGSALIGVFWGVLIEIAAGTAIHQAWTALT